MRFFTGLLIGLTAFATTADARHGRRASAPVRVSIVKTVVDGRGTAIVTGGGCTVVATSAESREIPPEFHIGAGCLDLGSIVR